MTDRGHPTALVIGASGQVGRHCYEAFSRRDYRVVGTDETQSPAGLPRADLADPSSIQSVVEEVRPAVCVLSGALTNVDRCESEPELARRINADGPRIVAEACRRVGAQVVFLSSEYVFDGTAGPYAEEDAPLPLSVYGETKLEGERAILTTDEGNLVIRTTVVYSFDPQGKNFVMQLLGRLGAGERMRVPLDQVSSPTHAADLAGAIVALVERRAGGIRHVAGPDTVGRYDFARRAASVLRLPVELLDPVSTEALQQKAKRPLRAGLRTDLLRRECGNIMRGIEDGIAQVAADAASSGFQPPSPH